MSLKSECQESVYSFAPLHKQLNAELFDEHKEYIKIVITLHRDEYETQKAAGATSFTLSEDSKTFLTNTKPY